MLKLKFFVFNVNTMVSNKHLRKKVKLLYAFGNCYIV
jgi:hypothetical protein